MSIKLTRKQLKQIILEELEEIRAGSREFGPAQVATAKALSAKGVAKRPESVRTRLMQLVADLDLQNPTQEEIRQLADMVSDLMDAAQDADEVGLEEFIKNELIAVLDEKKNKKACKPSKGKRFAKRVNGKCRSYGQKGQAKSGGDRIRPGTKKGDAYCARSAKIKKCKNPPCANALSRKKWKCRGSKSMKE